ncbi:glutamine-hydrolyzing asparagine synthase [Basidiobolus meristosporus CBS 931.73]|uniref:Glutamine-hydrolyzing asparagine synthase n=1 Tax=Basidiobolus meristosporus CBS 931.73 TaxID=1314790 RepID=A0A1Y1XSW8_9FUNG|nr:glutamine-hydrolyzing asparagine synthase [Basidiobolus meristosporus CBS 931.73]|eukprot:ORX88596.1 glutamine-hydrolyzing asparagine synthase [Basidiobolus meristosporus CBS 931.73]
MCGIVAYVDCDSCQLEPITKAKLDASLHSILHRGPDSNGRYIDPSNRVGLGHTRLSIIDLDGGQQPISNKTNTIHIIVNGEFYDFERIREELIAAGHTFKTSSDSEIALHLYEEYGYSFLEHLRGEFALCLWDTKRSIFLAARDRFGIKPLYYANKDGRLYVASEIKAFPPLGLKMAWDVDSIVHGGPMTDMRTPFAGIAKLSPGHYITATLSGSVHIEKYWDADYPDKTVKDARSVEEMVEGVRSRLVEAVRQRLRSDVPVGVYLSGGIDSSSIAGIATSILRERDPNARIRAFTISFPGGNNSNEGPVAERTAEFCNAIFDKLEVTDEKVAESFEDAIWHFEMPIPNVNGVGKFLLSRFVRDAGYKVVLTGEGSDEHFAGYKFFEPDYLLEPDLATPFKPLSESDRLDLLSNYKPSTQLKVYASMGEKIEIEGSPVSKRMLNGINTPRTLSKLVFINKEVYPDHVLSRTGAPDLSLALASGLSGEARRKIAHKWHPLHAALYSENKTVLPNGLCNFLGDRSEMAHSIEARTPFLDHFLTEYVNDLPPSVKFKPSEKGELVEKWILREAVKPYITEELYLRTKHPFIAPAARDTYSPISRLFREKITKESCGALGWLKWEPVADIMTKYFETGDQVAHNALLVLTSYVILGERFRVATYTPIRNVTIDAK